MRGKSTSGQAVALVCSWLKRQCICDYSITMCTDRRTSIYLHTSSTKLKPLVVPPALCTVYFILNFLPKLEASALRALPNWAHQAKQSGLGWIYTSSGNNQCENGPNENLSFKSCHVWKLYRASGRAQSKGGLFQKGKRRGVLSHLWFNGFSGARVWVTIPEQAKMLRHPHYSWTALWTPWENMCDAGIILLIKRDLNLEHCSRMFPGRQKRKNPAALPITNNVDLSLLHQDSR